MANQADIVKAALFTPGLNGRWGLPLILWGEPGIAKSARLQSIAEECGLSFNSTIASICEPADLAGYPIPNEERTMVNPLPPPWIHRVNSAGGALQLFDEATSCSSAAHAALMRIVLEGKAGDVDVDPGVRFVMAANPTSCAANANELAIPLANRFGHLQWSAGNHQDWVAWLQGGNVQSGAPMTAAERESFVMARWKAAFAEAKGLVGAFIHERGEGVLHKMPAINSGESSLAWPSRRTWEMATRAFASSKIHGLSEAERTIFVSAFIGTGPATEFLAYVKNMDLPSSVDVLDGKVKFKHKASRMDITLAVLGGCAAYLLATAPKDIEAEAKKTGAAGKGFDQWMKRLDGYYAVCQHVLDKNAAELVVPSAKLMTERQYGTSLFNRFGEGRIDDVKNAKVYDVYLRLTPLVAKVMNR